MIFTERKDW